MILLPMLLFAYSFLSVFHPIDHSYDTDLFWHLKTGEVIVKEGGIPAEDPFTYLSKDPLRQTLVLRSYWLADLVLYAVFAFAGYAGLVVLKAATISLTLLFVFLSLQHRGWLTTVSLSFLLAFYLSTWGVLKPNLFTFVLLASSVYCMERYRRVGRWSYQAGVIGSMVLWANMHGGYVFGVAIMGMYAFMEGAQALAAWKGGRHEEARRLGRVVATAVAAGASSLLNPGGATSFRVALELGREPLQRSMTGIIQEHLGYFVHLNHFANFPMFWGLGLAGLVVIFTILNILRRKAGPTEVAVVAVMLALAAWSIRVFPLFLIAGFILSMGKDRYGMALFQVDNRYKMSAGVVVGSIMAFFLWWQFPTSAPGRLLETVSLPHRTVEFLANHQVRGNMLNLHGPGNYLLFSLYPKYRVFTDTRYVSVRAFFDANAMFDGRVEAGETAEWYDYSRAAKAHVEYLKNPGTRDWRGEHWYWLMEEYGVDFVVGKMVDNSGMIFPMFLKLARDPRWALIYRDGNYVIMVKENGVNDDLLERIPRQDKMQLYDQAISELRPLNTPFSIESLAFVFAVQGDYDRAEQLARGAMKINPGFLIAPAVIDYVSLKRAAGKEAASGAKE